MLVGDKNDREVTKTCHPVSPLSIGLIASGDKMTRRNRKEIKKIKEEDIEKVTAKMEKFLSSRHHSNENPTICRKNSGDSFPSSFVTDFVTPRGAE